MLVYLECGRSFPERVHGCPGRRGCKLHGGGGSLKSNFTFELKKRPRLSTG